MSGWDILNPLATRRSFFSRRRTTDRELQPSHASCYEHHTNGCEHHWSNHLGLFPTLMFLRSQNSWPTGLNHTTCFPGPAKIALALSDCV